MIVIKVEMWPGGDPKRAVEFARATITNQVDATLATGGKTGDYVAKFSKGIWGQPNTYCKGVWHEGLVVGFNRQTRGVWDLLYLALRSTVGRRNG